MLNMDSLGRTDFVCVCLCQFVLNFKGLPAFSNMETNVVFLVAVMFHQ